MKKKIKELTLDEIFKLKGKCKEQKNCAECEINNYAGYMVCDLNFLIDNIDSLDKEIEVSDND